MQVLIRRLAASAAEGVAPELPVPHFAAESAWLGEAAVTTRTPSSADGGLSSLSSPMTHQMDSSVVWEQDMCDGLGTLSGSDVFTTALGHLGQLSLPCSSSPVHTVHPVHPVPAALLEPLDSGTPAEDMALELEDGFALPPPALDLQDPDGRELIIDWRNMYSVVPDDDRAISSSLAADAEVLGGCDWPMDMRLDDPREEEVQADDLILVNRCQLATHGSESKVMAAISSPMHLPDSWSSTSKRRTRQREHILLTAIMERWAVPPRREVLQRRGAVRVGRRRVACRPRPVAWGAAVRRYVPCSGAR